MDEPTQERIQKLEQALIDRTRELEVLQQVQQAINSQLDLDRVLQLIADTARQLTNCRLSTVYLLEGDDLVLAVYSGEIPGGIQPGYQMPVEGSVAGAVIREGQPTTVLDAHRDPRVFQDAVARSKVESFLIVPLISGGKPVGVISVANKVQGQLTPEDERILNLMASSAVISLENARLYEQAAEMAVMAERNRLARDLHDAVTQSLFSASLIGDVLPQIWEANPAEGRIRLEELRRLTRGALAEMRTMLLELRPGALREARLDDLLRHLVNAFSGRTQIQVELTITGQCTPPELVKISLYRIAQEALNNIAKHSDAAHVWLRLSCESEQIALEVLDDGIGFNPQQSSPDHLGMGIMRERAEQIGAVLIIDSSPGENTRVKVTWQPGSSPITGVNT